MVRRRYYRLKHYNNMADKLEKTRVLAACHIIVGFLLVCLGIADRIERTFFGIICMGIWIGTWVSRIGSMSIVDFCFYNQGRQNVQTSRWRDKVFHFHCGFRYLESGPRSVENIQRRGSQILNCKSVFCINISRDFLKQTFWSVLNIVEDADVVT